MPVRIAINGAGRIGRMVMRLALNDPEVEVVALNDPFMDAASFAYLFKYDSVHGKFKGDITHDEKNIILEGKKIVIFTEKNPNDVAWDDLNVDIVLECTGRFKEAGADSAGGHHSGAKNQNVKAVIISCPAGADIPTFVMGVNQNKYEPSMKVISNASCTTNCLAPVAKVLNDTWGIEQGLMTTVHAATATQLVVDGASKKDYRGGRSVFNNIIPSSTGAAKAVGLVIPELKGKLTGMAMRVPTPDVSVVDLTVTLKKPATYAEIKAAMKTASETYLKGTLAYTEDDVVSTDFVDETHTSVFDANAGIAISDTFVKVIAWYDNEVGYSYSLLNLAKHVLASQ